MNKDFFEILSKFQDYEFFALEHYIHIARMLRDLISKNGLDIKNVADRIGVPAKRIPAMLNGAYDFDLMILSKVHALYYEIEAKKTKIKVEAENIGFVAYKEQYPLYVNRIEKLLEILEEKNKK